MLKKKNNEKNLGRALLKNRFVTNNSGKRNNSDLHSIDLKDGYDWGFFNLQSITEESSFQEFINTAKLAGTEFQAEKLNIKLITAKSQSDTSFVEEKTALKDTQEKHKSFLKIPRRPEWNDLTTAADLQIKEKEQFLEWRRKLATLEEKEELILTPYEKNLEYWRQLWRVLERSDIIVQIVDARNPLLFRCEDLEMYVKEINSNKKNVILLNKADFLTDMQRKIWAEYFSKMNIQVVFFSAILNIEKKDEQVYKNQNTNIGGTDENTFKVQNSSTLINKPDLLNREQLIQYFENLIPEKTTDGGLLTVGLVGYPNVGKSSTINALLLNKKVSVSATPGKTKHFQTLHLTENILLCDCPGLVMPSFVNTKSEMLLNGILSINEMRDYISPINLLGKLIPKHIIEDLYGIMIQSSSAQSSYESPTAEEILNAHGYNRGFMTQHGQPDKSRSARCILRDFFNGKLLYCAAPPNYNQEDFHIFPQSTRKTITNLPPRTLRATKTSKITSQELDKTFFGNCSNGLHTKGKNSLFVASNHSSSNTSTHSLQNQGKPWKEINKHVNKKKKEKSRRIYSHLDIH